MKKPFRFFIALIFGVLCIGVALLGISVFICKAYDLFTESKDTNWGNVSLPRLSKGIACDEKNNCIDAYIAIRKVNSELVKAFKEKEEELARNNLPICLLSLGGDSKDALEISKIIRKHKLSTCLASKYKLPQGELVKTYNTNGITYNNPCLSACGFLMLSGHKRFVLGNNFALGVHSPRMSLDLCYHTISLPYDVDSEQITELIELTPSKLDKEAFKRYYEYSLTIPSDDMKILSQEQLLEYRVFN